MFRFKIVLIVHFLSVCVFSAVASGERVGLSTINTPEAAMMKIVEHRRKQCLVIIFNNNGYLFIIIIIIIIIIIVIIFHSLMKHPGTLFFTTTPLSTRMYIPVPLGKRKSEDKNLKVIWYLILYQYGTIRPGADQSNKAAFGKSTFAKTCFLLLKI